MEFVTTPSGYAFQLVGNPDYAMVSVRVPMGKMLKVEASSMATMDTNMVMKTKIRGGLGRLLTGESVFINEFTAARGAAEIGVAPGTPGDVRHVALNNATLLLQNTAYLASTPGITVESQWQGMIKGFFSGTGLFLIRCHGSGDLWFNSYGAMLEVDVDGEYFVDTGHIVAFSPTLNYQVRSIGGYKSLFFSGEGLVCRFEGKGKIWLQARKLPPFLRWVHTYRPVKRGD